MKFKKDGKVYNLAEAIFEFASVRFCADFEIIEQEENDECSK